MKETKKLRIKEITNEIYPIPCLVGMQGFDEDIQQFTCKCFNGIYCACYKQFKEHLEKRLK